MDIKNTDYWTIFADCFNYLRESFPVGDNQDSVYWQDRIDKADDLHKKYSQSKQYDLLADLLMAILEELQRVMEDGEKD